MMRSRLFQNVSSWPKPVGLLWIVQQREADVSFMDIAAARHQYSPVEFFGLELLKMLFKAATLDDALGDIIRHLLRRGVPSLSSKGRAREFTGVLVELSDPRARFSRTEGRGTLFSSIGETLWYFSGSDRLDHIEYYIPKYRNFIKASPRAVRAPGAYGPRLFGGGEKSQMAMLLASLLTSR